MANRPEWTNEDMAKRLEWLYRVTENAFALLERKGLSGDYEPSLWDQAIEQTKEDQAGSRPA